MCRIVFIVSHGHSVECDVITQYGRHKALCGLINEAIVWFPRERNRYQLLSDKHHCKYERFLQSMVWKCGKTICLLTLWVWKARKLELRTDITVIRPRLHFCEFRERVFLMPTMWSVTHAHWRKPMTFNKNLFHTCFVFKVSFVF